ncbi:hypothetical protein E2C01_028455 [Portunus trituberculatus]|uniref:Uncharacterized protein n=1 Tax=Portunus trituberculatus TaxID=210409 RepID=A0A5B7ERQ9_PORTR|nr:hypothetical protein [Portunus trituberculatus]
MIGIWRRTTAPASPTLTTGRQERVFWEDFKFKTFPVFPNFTHIVAIKSKIEQILLVFYEF